MRPSREVSVVHLATLAFVKESESNNKDRGGRQGFAQDGKSHQEEWLDCAI